MKKYYFILAAAALGFASCSNDETIESAALSESNEISFRTSVAGQTRAAAIATTENISSFKAMAMQNKTTTSYFAWDTFTKGTDGYFVGTNKHYWPASGALDFYAYAPTSLSPSDYRTFAITTAATAETQIDLVYAASKAKEKATSANGVNLNFRHAGSQIVIKVMNSSPSLKFAITDCKLVNLKNSGTFTAPIDYSSDASNTESGTGTGAAASTFASGWDDLSGSASFTSTETKNVGISEAASIYGDEDQAFVLIPQTVTPAAAYASASGQPSNSYVALKMVIKNNDAGETTIADATSANNWAIWPIPSINWAPGYKYTYTIDLAGGGFWETDQTTINPGTLVLDPILAGAEIKFLTVTVDTWETSDQSVTDVNYAWEASASKSLGTGIAAGTTGTYAIKVNGLTSGKAASISATTGDFAASVSPLTVGTDGTVTINATLSNATAATDNSFTLNVADMGTMTFTLTRVAP